MMTVYLTTAGRKSFAFNTENDAFARWLPQGQSIDLLSRDGRATYMQLYLQQPWVFAAVNKLSRGVSSLPFKHYQTSGDGQDVSRSRQRESDHPAAALAASPWMGASDFTFWECVMGSLGVYGNAGVVKLRESVSSLPDALMPVDWRNVRWKTDASTGTVAVWEVRVREGEWVSLLPRDFMHFHYWGGVSPLKALTTTLQLEDAAQGWQKGSMVNGAKPSGVLSTEQKLTKDQRSSLRDEIEANHSGAQNAFRVMIAEAGVSWQAMAHTAKDSELIATRKLNREEVTAVYDIPPPVLHQLERSTFNNITELHKAFYMDTLRPITVMLENTWNQQLIQAEPEWVSDRVFAEFDFTGVLRSDLRSRAESYALMIQAGVMTPNEARQRENLRRSDQAAADELQQPMNMSTIGRVPEGGSTTGEDDEVT